MYVVGSYVTLHEYYVPVLMYNNVNRPAGLGRYMCVGLVHVILGLLG